MSKKEDNLTLISEKRIRELLKKEKIYEEALKRIAITRGNVQTQNKGLMKYEIAQIALNETGALE